MADFPSRLRELRAQKKLRQKDLAAQLGVAQTTVANYEQGSRFPGEKTLERIADFFDVSLDYLLGRAESSIRHEPFPNPREAESAPLSPAGRRYLDTLLAGNREEAGRLVRSLATKKGGFIAGDYSAGDVIGITEESRLEAFRAFCKAGNAQDVLAQVCRST